MKRSVILDAADAQRLLLGCRGTCAVVGVCLARYRDSGDAEWAAAFSPPSICPRHTHCRIVNVRPRSEREMCEIIAARVFNAEFDTTELRARQAARAQR